MLLDAGLVLGGALALAAAAIARLLLNRGINVGVMKPVTSGCGDRDGKRISEDAELLAWSAGCDPADPDIYPYCLAAPVAPLASCM